MKKSILGIFAAGCMLLAFSTTSNAQKIAKTLNAKTVDVSRGANPNIKSEAPTADIAESKPRGAYCSINFYNYTGFYVNIYVDGYAKGQLAPRSSGSVTVGEGYTTVYCISAGKTREWSGDGNCIGLYEFNLYE